MSLEDPDTIDIITRPEPNRLELVITDAGITTDPGERMEKLLAKLRNYVGYILSPEFAEEYPELGPDDVSITVVSATPPNSEMLQISHVKPRTEPPRFIAVRFMQFQDG